MHILHINSEKDVIKIDQMIKQGKDVAHLEGIGKGMIQKINTILETGTLPIIQEIKTMKYSNNSISIADYRSVNDGKKDTENENKDNLKHVLGFGEKECQKLKTQYSITNIQQLNEYINQHPGKIKLTKTQLIGIL